MTSAPTFHPTVDPDDYRSLLRALGMAVDAGVSRRALTSAITAVLADDAGPVEVALTLRRLADGQGRRRR